MKNNIIAAAKQYSDYITSQVPQKDENGNIKYYFSGSIAMLLLNSAVFVKSSYMNNDGQIVRDRQEFLIPEKHKESLLKGVRPLTSDIDLVVTDTQYMSGKNKPFMLNYVKENCNLALDLCPNWSTVIVNNVLDVLSFDRNITGHDIAELTMMDGSSVYVADPLCLTMHKFADALTCLRVIERMNNGEIKATRLEEVKAKYKKDIQDFTSLFNGVVILYSDLDFQRIINHVYETCSDTAFSSNLNMDSINRIQQFYSDSIKFIDSDIQNLFGAFIGEIMSFNKEKINEKSTSMTQEKNIIKKIN